jgi:hypothetical protein
MDRKFYNDEFEDLIRQKAGQYKMYPSDKVWKNIHASLHTRRRWFIAGMFTLITTILFFAGKELLGPSVHISSVHKAADHTDNKISDNKTGEKNNNDIASDKTIPEIPIAPAFAEYKPNTESEKRNGNEMAIAAISDMAVRNVSANINIIEEQPNLIPINAEETDNDFMAKSRQDFYPRKIEISSTDKNQSSELQTAAPAAIDPNPEHTTTGHLSDGIELDKKYVGILQNTAPYQLISPRKLNRKYWQLYFAPSATYRTLSGAAFHTSKPDIQNGPIAATAQDANPNLYTYNKPALGFEMGGSILYRFTRNLSFKAGLQFNYSRYTINAYVSNTQPATIALNSFNGYPGNTITAYTNIGTIGGKAAVNLQNQYFQLSVPFGFEMRIIGNEKLQLNIGATVQPTYLMNRDSYLLTSDFANYTQEPSLFRKWNVNGALEAFITYKTGKIRWQLGPQFRYQLLSTYTSEYPMNENLKGLGIKFGISKTIW